MLPSLSTSFLASAFGSNPEGPEQDFTQLITDSRLVKPGSFFIALAGEQADGHKFLEQAVAAGAAGVLHRKDHALKLPAGVTRFTAADTLAAYRSLALAWRRLFPLPVIGICGSAGKTTTKEFLAALLRGRWPEGVLQTLASQNGFSGIPATLFRLGPEHSAAVVEIGIDEPGAMAQHLRIVEPTAGILTSIGPEHLEKLIDVETVAREESELFRFLDKHGGKIAVNADDPLIFRAAGELKKAERVFFSLENRACGNFRGRELHGEWEAGSNSLKVRWHELGQEIRTETFPLPLEGRHNALNLLGAIALADLHGLTPEEIRCGLATFQPPEGRSRVESFQGARFYCDTYNANPISVRAALEFLRKPAAGGATWAALGDMLELGEKEHELHRELAELLITLQVDKVLLFGPRMQQLAAALKAAGHKATEHFAAHAELAARLRQGVRPGDTVLLKGSRGMRMETVWQLLQAGH